MTEGLVRMVRLVRMEGGKREDGDKPSYIHLRGGASHRGEGIQIQIQIYIQIQIHKHKGKGDQGQVQMVSCCCDANSGKEGAARLMCRQN